jgi:hypothetical protein
LQLPTTPDIKLKLEPKVETSFVAQSKLEIDKPPVEAEKKPEILEKVVSLNSNAKGANVQFKKRTVNQQSSRQRNDD